MASLFRRHVLQWQSEHRSLSWRASWLWSLLNIRRCCCRVRRALAVESERRIGILCWLFWYDRLRRRYTMQRRRCESFTGSIGNAQCVNTWCSMLDQNNSTNDLPEDSDNATNTRIFRVNSQNINRGVSFRERCPYSMIWKIPHSTNLIQMILCQTTRNKVTACYWLSVFHPRKLQVLSLRRFRSHLHMQARSF